MSIYTLACRNFSHRSPTISHKEQDIAFGNDVVTCTVTNSPLVVDEWISETKSLNNVPNLGPHNRLVVGLEAEWHPSGQHNPVATLQLCVGRRCLVFQLLYASFVPRSLGDFMCDFNHVSVGVGVYNDVQKLWNDHRLQVSNVVDLAKVAWRRVPSLNGSSAPGLRFLANVVLGVDIERPLNVTLSDWDNRHLSIEQVEYACVPAFASFEIGSIWRVGQLESESEIGSVSGEK